MSELSIVVDEESHLNTAWLPVEAAYSRLTLLHYVHALLRHAKSSSFHRLGEPKVSPPADSPDWARVVPGDHFDDRMRLLTIALQQDIEWIRDRLPKLLECVGLPASWGRIQQPDLEGPALQGFTPDKAGWTPFEHETRQCLIRGLTDIETWLEKSALETELPRGWEPDASGSWPLNPVRNVAELKEHLADLLAMTQKHGSYPGNLDIMTRELRNTRRALRKFFDDITIRPTVNDIPKDAFEAERELERLVDLLTLALVRDESEVASAPPQIDLKLLTDSTADEIESRDPDPQDETVNGSPETEQTLPAPPLLNDVCLEILKALDGQALTLESLAKIVSGGETSPLYRNGLKSILMANGRVQHAKKIGYYRPDRPPLDRVVKVSKVSAK